MLRRTEDQCLLEAMFDNKRQYKMPVYQRNYDWKRVNYEILFNDASMTCREI